MSFNIAFYNIPIIALFRLRALNVAFWLTAPTLASRAYYENHINDRIDGLWRIHMNRVDQSKLTCPFLLLTQSQFFL